MADIERDSHYARRRSTSHSAAPSTTRGGRRRSHGWTTNEDIILEDLQGPSEVTAPAPVVSRYVDPQRVPSPPGSSRASTPGSHNNAKYRRAKRQRSSISEGFGDLAEVVAPPPVPDEDLQRPGLEDFIQESRHGTPGAEQGVTALPELPEPQVELPLQELTPLEEFISSKRTKSRQRASRIATELYTVSYFILFAILGTLARLGIQWLTFYPGAPVIFPVLWANFAGTLFLGFLSEDQHIFREEWGLSLSSATFRKGNDDEEKLVAKAPFPKGSHVQVKKTIPLYIGLATGFCGSLTSFSTFLLDTFLALSNDLPSPNSRSLSSVPRHRGYSFQAVTAILIATPTVSISALKLGAHIALATSKFTPTIRFRLLRRFLDPMLSILAGLTWLGAIAMAIWPPDAPYGPQSKGSWANETWRGQAIFACVFAPVGCLLRFYTSLRLNAVAPSFPLGTFLVNMLGTGIMGMAFDLQHVRIGVGIGGGRVGCQVLQGVMDGFCGSLTTVSTWVLELSGLRLRHAYMYGLASVAVGLGLMTAVLGSVRWTVGWEEVACVI